MKPAVEEAIAELKKQFFNCEFIIRSDDSGGAYIIISQVRLSSKLSPNNGWIGFHIAAQYPYADIYPVFIDGSVRKLDGQGFQAPVTAGHYFEGRSALQVSRRNSAGQNSMQKATIKILKVLDYLERQL